VIVTHDVDEAVNLADRVLVLAHDSTGIATIQHDIRPSPNKHARFDEIEAIIAALESTKREVA
jgi:ABC-type nitrate/sulfonate/bicarbonate transport system ATPase subunit